MSEAKRPWWVPALGVAVLLSLVTAPAWLIIAGAIHADMQKRLVVYGSCAGEGGSV